MRAITRNVNDHRRATELDKKQPQSKFRSTPNIKHLNDGDIVIIKGSSKLVWRDGDTLYEVTGTPV